MKKRTVWTLGSFVALGLSYILCRFLSLEIHWNTDWSLIMFVAGLVVLLIAALTYSKKIMICTVAGYIIGFAAGTIFDFDIVINPYGDTGGAWFHIWTYSFLAIILIGVVWEIISMIVKKRKHTV